MLIVGGGGGGGRADQYVVPIGNVRVMRRACTGTQAAMVYVSDVYLTKDDSLTIKVGDGGGASTDYYQSGMSGSESYVYNKNGLIAVLTAEVVAAATKLVVVFPKEQSLVSTHQAEADQ